MSRDHSTHVLLLGGYNVDRQAGYWLQRIIEAKKFGYKERIVIRVTVDTVGDVPEEPEEQEHSSNVE